MIWPPDYTQEFKRRLKLLQALNASPKLRQSAKKHYSENAVGFINDWCIVYEPRNAGTGVPTTLPFTLFPRQQEFIEFVLACLNAGAPGLVEKCRDVGATWLGTALSVWIYLFKPGYSVGWGSRKAKLVDHLGDPDSIFEKIRLQLRYVPEFFLPLGFTEKDHSFQMRLINPETGTTITGEAGDNIGRGGRKSIYMKDESAYYERPEAIEAALSENTNVQIDISSVNGTGNIFARKRRSGVIWNPGQPVLKHKTNVFIFDWRDHPAKDDAWYEAKRKKAVSDGLSHIFAQEVDRDYASAVKGVVIPAVWVKACIDAHVKLNFTGEGASISALDVADGGTDSNVHANRKGVVLRHLAEWAQQVDDVGETALLTVSQAQELRASELHYDSIGVGSGVKSETNRLYRDGILDEDHLNCIAWCASEGPQDPEENIVSGDDETPLNKDFFANLKAQGWWSLRRRCEKTYNAVVKGAVYDEAELISFSSTIDGLHELVEQLSQPTYAHDGAKKLLINKKPEGTASPNKADAVMMCYFPVEEPKLFIA